MSVGLYDNALINKFKYWTEGTQAKLYSPEETSRLFEVIADEAGDKPIQLPIICLRRKPSYTILNINKKPLTYDGITVDTSVETSIHLNAIPVQLFYQLDVYTRYLYQADEYMRNFIFNMINYPTVEVTIPYHDYNLKHNSTLRISQDVTDNSDIPERIISGQFTRFTLEFTVDDAYLWDIREGANYKLYVDVTENEPHSN